MKRKKILLMMCLMMLPLLSLAEGGLPPDCGLNDPLDNYCPLDSWTCMLVLAPVAATLTAVFLRSQAIKELEKNKRDNLLSINKDGIVAAAPSSDKHSTAA